MHLSLTPFLLAAELGFLFLLAVHSQRLTLPRPNMLPVRIYLVWLVAYGVATSVLGAHGLYIHPDILALLPGLWLQLITVAAAVLPAVLFASVRNGLRLMVDTTPWHWFAWFHVMRIAALGTAVKTMWGEFPLYFELLVGVPDLAFGLSALWIVSKAKRGALSTEAFLRWNLIGLLVIVPSAPILLQLGLPGPLQVFTGEPDARAVYTYPMSIAPMMGVPLFALINMWVAWRLWERLSGKAAASGVRAGVT